MAEAEVVEPTPSSSCRYFCHKCNVEIIPQLPGGAGQEDYVCPRCNSGFIELLDPMESDSDDSSIDFDMDIGPFGLFSQPDFDNRNTNNTESSSTSSGGARRSSAHMRRLNPRHIRRRTNVDRQSALAPLLHDLIMQMTSGVLEANVGAADYRVIPGSVEIPMLLSSSLASNPGDYAWGRGGLDAIITQLMNQLDGTGPPPLSKEKIAQIPSVKITKEQTEINLQCSVCMEDFKEDETVRQLNCEHCYHTDCIIPWLELHGTCPVCRKSLTEHRTRGNSTGGTSSANLMASFLDSQRSNPVLENLTNSRTSNSNPSETDSENQERASTSRDPSNSTMYDLDDLE